MAPVPVLTPTSGLRPLNHDQNDDDEEAAPDSNDFQGFLREIVKLYEQEGEGDVAEEVDDAEYIEEDDDVGCDGVEEELPEVDSSDFADVIAKASSGETWLPPFLDHKAKLDKDYPTVESFLQDNEAEMADFRKMVTTACRYAKEFTRVTPRAAYMKRHDFDKEMEDQWFNFWSNAADPDFVANMAMRAVPIQASAAMGRVDFSIEDLARMPHFPPAVVYGCYFDNITKTYNDGRDAPATRLAYHGVSVSKDGVLRGRIKGHLTNLRTNYADLKEADQSRLGRQAMGREARPLQALHAMPGHQKDPLPEVEARVQLLQD